MNHRLNWKPDLPDKRDLKYAPSRLALPTKIDLRQEYPAIYDQLNIGSCTGNAIAAFYGKVNNAYQPVSRLFIYYNERVIEGTVGEDSGATLRSGIKVLYKQGVCLEAKWQYLESNLFRKPIKTAYKQARHNKIRLYKRINQDLSMMKSCLAEKLPFVFGFTVYESFDSGGVETSGIMMMPDFHTESILGGHAVMAVGYDDDINSMIIKNSWGRDWGKGGYFLMPYDFISDPDLCADFWTVTL